MAAHVTRERKKLDRLRASLATFDVQCADLSEKIDTARATVRAAEEIGVESAPHIIELRVGIAMYGHRLAQHRRQAEATREAIARREQRLTRRTTRRPETTHE